jgi:hypothetical protein
MLRNCLARLAAEEREKTYARLCAKWAASRPGMPGWRDYWREAVYQGPGGRPIGSPPPSVPTPPEIGAPGAAQAQEGADPYAQTRRTWLRRESVRPPSPGGDPDPGRESGYRPAWAVPLGRRP